MKRTMLFALLLLPSSLFAGDLTGTFNRGARYEPPADHAPAAVSRMFVRMLTRESSSLDLPAAGGSGMLIWTMPRPLGTRLTTPTGDVLGRGENGSLERGLRRFRFNADTASADLPPGKHEVLHVLRAEAASYRLEVDMPAEVPGIMVVAAEPDSRITLETWVAPLSRQPGEAVTLHAALRDGSEAITGAKVTVRLAAVGAAGSAPIELRDGGNGVYSATLAELPSEATGTWQARFEADGQNASGIRFARTGIGELVAERGVARLDAESVRGSRIDGVLRVTAAAEVLVAGAYRFDVIVAGAADVNGERPALAWGEGVRQLARGTNTLTLDIPGVDAGELHLDVRLLGLDDIGVAGRVVADVRD